MEVTITNMIVSIKKVNKTKVKLKSLVTGTLCIKMKGNALNPQQKCVGNNRNNKGENQLVYML